MKALESNADLNYADINKVLGLPAATRIREIDGQAATSAMAIVQLSMVALAADKPFRLTLNENDWEEMYLMPAE